MAVQDRRRDNIISITYEPQEEFTDHSNKEPMILTIVSNGTYQLLRTEHVFDLMPTVAWNRCEKEMTGFLRKVMQSNDYIE